MSASSNGSRSPQRSAMLRRLSVATWTSSATGGARAGGGASVGGRVRDGDRERKRRAPALLGVDANHASVALHDVARNGEAEARSPAGRPGPVTLVETLEDPRLIARRDPRPV